MTSVCQIMFAVVCTLPRPDAPEPMHFGYGKAVNRAVIAASFVPQTPDIGPVVAMKPSEPVQKRPQQRRDERSGEGLAVLAYAPARASGKQFEAISRGSFQVAHSRVDTSCFPKRLVGIIRDAERHFGGRAIITSGYRSKSYNRRVKGVRGSMHIRCAAADLRIPGVSKTRLHRYLLRHPKRGGVGIYRGEYLHVDIGHRRTWDWR